MKLSTVIILILIVFTAVKACDLDSILDDLYEDLESEEDDAKPDKSTTQAPTTTPAPSSTTSSSNNTPPLSPSTTTPAPISSSTTPQPRARGKLRRHSFHRRRHLIRKAAEAKGEIGRDLYSGTDPYSTRYAPNQPGARNLVYKPSELIEELSQLDEPSDINDPVDDKLVGQGRSESVLVIPVEDEAELDESRSMWHNGANENIHLTKDDIHKILLRSGGTMYSLPVKQPQHRQSLNRHHKTPPRHNSKKEETRSPLVDIIIVNNYPTRMQNNKSRPPALNNIDAGKTKPNNRSKLLTRPKHIRRPIINGPSDELHSNDKGQPLEMHSPCSSTENINEMNRVKEHTIHETIRIDPKDNSEIRNVEEKIIYSIIKKPCMSAENINENTRPSLSEAIASMEMPPKPGQQIKGTAAKQTMNVKDEEQIFVQQLPAIKSQVQFQKENVKGNNKDSLLEHTLYDIRPIDSNSGIHQQHDHKSPSTPPKVGHDLVQEKNIYGPPNTNIYHHEELNKHDSALKVSNNSPTYEAQPYPLMSEYNVYGSLPKFPINNRDGVQYPPSHSSIVEHDSRPAHPSQDYGYLQPHAADLSNRFTESKNDGLVQVSHEQHHSMIDSPTTSAPKKIINVV